MFVLDTDHMSLLEWDSNSATHLRERLSDCEQHEVATTVINYEEQIRGWMAYIASSR
jgi:tRNA(fMet)-specific endonuclease VapC